jgi:hypothetical protein
MVTQSLSIETKQAQDILWLIKLSTSTKLRLRFFNSKGSGSANEFLHHLTMGCITSTSFQTPAAQFSIDKNMLILQYSGSWFIMRDWYVLSILCLELQDQIQFRDLCFFTVGMYDLYQSNDNFSNAKTVIGNTEGGVNHFDLAIIKLHHANFLQEHII